MEPVTRTQGNIIIRRESNSKGILYLFSKRLIDIVGSIVGLLLFFSSFLIIGILIKLEDPKGAILYKQTRNGVNGRPFYIFKYRSMITNAEEKLKNNKKLYEKYLENNYKLEPEEDPRITRIGRFLRKTSLDELPQFINVFKGEMSLVGPRPIVEEEIKEYKDKKDLFLSVKPGITGYWQISGRSDVGYPERVDLELYYVYNKSLKLDLMILFKTVFLVVLRKGAY